MGMYWLTGTNYLIGGMLLLVANLAFGASIVLTNSFLPSIASPDRRTAVSAQSWALGFVGGGLFLSLSLGFYSERELFGLTEGHAVRISLLAAGLWWASFALIPLQALHQRPPLKTKAPGERYLALGFAQLRATLRRARRYPQTLRFLCAYMLYADGIAAIITLSVQFGS
jgi:UMF1 family MFS transporter